MILFAFKTSFATMALLGIVVVVILSVFAILRNITKDKQEIEAEVSSEVKIKIDLIDD